MKAERKDKEGSREREEMIESKTGMKKMEETIQR